MAKKKLTNEQVLEALRNAHGLKTGAAELLGVAFDTIERYIQRSPTAQAEVERWRKRRKDRAEYKLDEAIERGEPWAIMFTLKNARDREYSPRVDVTTDGKPLNDIDIKVRLIDYRQAIRQQELEDDRVEFADAAPRPGGDSATSSKNQGAGDGTPLGQDDARRQNSD